MSGLWEGESGQSRFTLLTEACRTRVDRLSTCVCMCPAMTIKVVQASVIDRPLSAGSRNYGFVEFENPEDAQTALAVLDRSQFMGYSIRVEMVSLLFGTPHPRKRSLIVNNLFL